MVIFWVAAGALAAAAAGLILFKAAGAARDEGSADPAPVLYRRQLSEIDELAERGLMGEAERKSAHAEAARRLLAATDAPKQTWSADARGRLGVLATAGLAAVAALALYLVIGSPATPDQPFARRLKAWNEPDKLQTLTAPEIAAVLRQKLKERGPDAEGERFLALAEMQSENFPAAVQALRRAVKVAPERADLWDGLGQALALEAGGKITDDAQDAFRQALKLDPTDLSARFYLAQAKLEAGQGAEAATDFRAILAALPSSDERRGSVEAAIAKAEGRNVQRADAGQMEMIRGMVAGLAAKLKANPDDPDGWVRLVRAYAVLGDVKSRDEAYATARARYAGKAMVLDQLDEAARAERMQ